MVWEAMNPPAPYMDVSILVFNNALKNITIPGKSNF